MRKKAKAHRETRRANQVKKSRPVPQTLNGIEKRNAVYIRSHQVKYTTFLLKNQGGFFYEESCILWALLVEQPDRAEH